MKILKYLDLFGIHFHFYTGNKRKLYTSYGGIISIICIFCCFLIFFILTLKELSHKNPISNMSSISQAGYHKVKFGQEKLWIPWRIIDFRKNFINFTNKLCPTIYSKKGEKNNNYKERFTFQSTKINYKLCNETEFAQRGKNHFIDAPLNELYCIEFDNLELGGGWTAEFLNYLQLDINICKVCNDGIEYDENNINCNKELYLSGDKWAFEYFYPIVEFQPSNYENPIFVIYKNHFYNFSSYLIKDERIYIQEYVLNDDKGLIFNDDKNSSFWGYFSSDFDFLYSKGNIINENSSKLYSLSIYLDAGKILYMRRYNKVYTIIANVFPLFNVAFFIFKSLTYMVKTIMTEKYLSELFFQRVNENDRINIDKDKRKSAGFFYRKLKLSQKELLANKNNPFISQKIKDYEISKNNVNELSSKSSDNDEEENIKNDSNKKENNNKENKNQENNKNSNSNKSENNKESNKKNYFAKSNKTIRKGKLRGTIISKNSSKCSGGNKSNLEKLKIVISNGNAFNNNNNNNNNNNSSLFALNSPKHNNYIDANLKATNSGKFDSTKKNPKILNKKSQILSNDAFNIELNTKNANKTGYDEKNVEVEDLNERNNYSHFNFYKNKGLNNSAIITRFRLKGSLFKMKDYIYSFFIKAIRKDYKYLSKEFAAIFNFLSDVYDISSYLQLYKQFHILSGFLLDNVANIDLNHKININNKELFEQIALKNKNIFYFALKEQFEQISEKK